MRHRLEGGRIGDGKFDSAVVNSRGSCRAPTHARKAINTDLSVDVDALEGHAMHARADCIANRLRGKGEFITLTQRHGNRHQ